MTESSLVDLLEPHRDDAWYPAEPAPEEQIEAAEAALGQRFPDDYRQLLRAAGGGGVYGSESRVLMIPPRHLIKFNPDMERAPDLADMMIFADDQGDYFYFFDPKNLLGRGPWAIFAVPMGSASRKHAIFVARDLRHLIERILAGEALIE
jgi:hypothetical protein